MSLNVLLAGYGKMGKFIFASLTEVPEINCIYVYDPAFRNCECEGKIHYISNLGLINKDIVDYAFIASPIKTHYMLVKHLLGIGITKIFVEKPAVTSVKEFNSICLIKGDASIVTGYILRQAEVAGKVKHYMKELEAQGYYMSACNVRYQKYLPAVSEPRAMNDEGVFEEIVHVWDLIFNYFGLKNMGEWGLSHCAYEFDPDRAERVIYTNLHYSLKNSENPAEIKIISSFKAPEKKREFGFVFKNDSGNTRNIHLSFDNSNNRDNFRVTDENGEVIIKEHSTSLLKLKHEIFDVFWYFESGANENLSLFDEAIEIIDLLSEVNSAIEKAQNKKLNNKKE